MEYGEMVLAEAQVEAEEGSRDRKDDRVTYVP